MRPTLTSICLAFLGAVLCVVPGGMMTARGAAPLTAYSSTSSESTLRSLTTPSPARTMKRSTLVSW